MSERRKDKRERCSLWQSCKKAADIMDGVLHNIGYLQPLCSVVPVYLHAGMSWSGE